MNEQNRKGERDVNNRCKLLHKFYAQKQKTAFNTMSFQLRVQNMLKQMSIQQNERSRCQSGCDQQFPLILRLKPMPLVKPLNSINLRLNTIKSTATRRSISGLDQVQQQPKHQYKKMTFNKNNTSSPVRFSSTHQKSIDSVILKNTLPAMPVNSKIDSQIQVEYNFLENISCWSRKSSESLI